MRYLTITVFVFAALGCAPTSDPAPLNTWEGIYSYEEQPLKANAGYFMVMNWKLDIHKDTAGTVGIIEINGQQTFTKLEMKIKGNEDSISLIYQKTIDGSSENLNIGDTVFKLHRNGTRLITQWGKLEPRLLDNPPTTCDSCFIKNGG